MWAPKVKVRARLRRRLNVSVWIKVRVKANVNVRVTTAIGGKFGVYYTVCTSLLIEKYCKSQSKSKSKTGAKSKQSWNRASQGFQDRLLSLFVENLLFMDTVFLLFICSFNSSRSSVSTQEVN